MPTFATLGRAVYRRRRAVAGLWLVFLAVSLALGPRIFDRLSTDLAIPETAADQAAARIQALTGGAGGLPDDVLAIVEGPPAAATDAVAELRRHPGVDRLAALPAADGGALLVALDTSGDAHHDAAAILRAIAGADVVVGGGELLDEEFVEATEADLQRGEAISLPIVLVLLLIVFGGFVAAGTPLLVALVTVPGALLVLYGVSQWSGIAFFAISVVSMLGLGLSVDYALLMVSRFREERAAGAGIEQAVVRTVATAGRTILFSGLTVIVALTAFLLYPADPLRTFTWAGGGVVALAVLAALTLLPALLGMWGSRVRPGRTARPDTGFFYRVSRIVQRRPVVILLTVGVALAALWIPFTGARLEESDWRGLPASSESRRVFETLDARFGGDRTQPIQVLAAGAGDDLAAALATLDGVRAVEARGGGLYDVLPEGPSRGPTAEAVVGKLRDLGLEVAGPAAEQADFRAFLFDRLPWVLAYIAAATFALLFLMTGSVVVPLKAIVMNVLSLGGTFGVLVWGFQDGALAGLLGFESTGALDTVVPLVIFVFAFGLSMDYEVFLLSRVKEIYDDTGDNDRAVALGLQRTGRIITSAAALIVVVFLGFALGETLVIKQFGVGMALAVAVDVTVVRTLIVPSSMKLMGRWNWWAPGPLRRLHRRVGLREAAPPSGAGQLERVEHVAGRVPGGGDDGQVGAAGRQLRQEEAGRVAVDGHEVVDLDAGAVR